MLRTWKSASNYAQQEEGTLRHPYLRVIVFTQQDTKEHLFLNNPAGVLLGAVTQLDLIEDIPLFSAGSVVGEELEGSSPSFSIPDVWQAVLRAFGHPERARQRVPAWAMLSVPACAAPSMLPFFLPRKSLSEIWQLGVSHHILFTFSRLRVKNSSARQ